MAKFKELISDDEYLAAYPVLKELDDRLEIDRFLLAMNHKLSKYSKLYAIEESGEIVSVAAVWILMTGTFDRIFWIHAFVTIKKHRSKGYGKLLLEGLKKVAAEYECSEIRVHAHREKAITYWTEKVGFQRFSKIFQLKDFA